MTYSGMSGGNLAATGVGAVAVGGIALQQMWLLALAGLLVVGGAVLIRMKYRRNKGISEA